MRRRQFFALFLCVLLQHAWVVVAQSAPPSIVLSTTTSLDNSGLLAKILSVITKETGITVDVLAIGTGRALAGKMPGLALAPLPDIHRHISAV
jgi:tungstate transport system substrate-binding protein